MLQRMSWRLAQGLTPRLNARWRGGGAAGGVPQPQAAEGVDAAAVVGLLQSVPAHSRPLRLGFIGGGVMAEGPPPPPPRPCLDYHFETASGWVAQLGAGGHRVGAAPRRRGGWLKERFHDTGPHPTHPTPTPTPPPPPPLALPPPPRATSVLRAMRPCVHCRVATLQPCWRGGWPRARPPPVTCWLPTRAQGPGPASRPGVWRCPPTMPTRCVLATWWWWL
jgi:hypothetical protein